ncbi:DUF6630 family protein [Chitinilyticum aquatile]|uniref:DUF6630 family protein n=1 Tax=Chitinilyticum aquatile TaxID=362520 RepID=UPI00041DC1FC|nr:hypothetical protein [Chitinilyticum aquatile]
MPAFPSYSQVEPADLAALLACSQPDGRSWHDGQFATAHTLYSDVLIIDPGYSDERELKIWLEGDRVEGICAVPDDGEAGGQAYYLLDEEDELLVTGVLQRMAADLLPRYRPQRSDAHAFLAWCIGEDAATRLLDERIGELPADGPRRWALLADVLDEAGQLVAFEWQAWHDEGVVELNALPILQQRGIAIPMPDAATRREVLGADDFNSAMFDYFRTYLDEGELMLVALGHAFSDYQTFVVLPLDDYRAARAIAMTASLGLAAQW